MSMKVLTGDDIKKLKDTREKLFFDYLKTRMPERPVTEKDLTLVRLKNMEEKIETLKSKVEEFCASEANSKKDSTYWSLSETCVKFQIQLDSINVIGREELRQRKRSLLIDVDQISTDLVRKIQGQGKKNPA